MATVDNFATPLFLLMFGLIGAIWPYHVAKLIVMVNSIGSSRPQEEAEPMDWYVRLVRMISILGAIVGAYGIYLWV